MWRCDNVGGLGDHVTCHLFGFLVYLFALFFGSRRASTSELILTIYTSYDVFPRKDVPLGVTFMLLSSLKGQIPKNTYFGR